MIRRIELTGDLGIVPGRGRRPIAQEIVEVTIAMAETAGRNVQLYRVFRNYSFKLIQEVDNIETNIFRYGTYGP